VRSASSKKPQSTTPRTSSAGSPADDALRIARILRAEGFHATAIRIGDVELHLAPVIEAKAPGAFAAPTRATAASVMEEYGGPEFAKALEQTAPDLVDDDEQPAVRS
jgi:hypothetical protein